MQVWSLHAELALVMVAFLLKCVHTWYDLMGNKVRPTSSSDHGQAGWGGAGDEHLVLASHHRLIRCIVSGLRMTEASMLP